MFEMRSRQRAFKRERDMIVIGVDPSLTATGVSAIDLRQNRVISWTVISSETDDSEKKLVDVARRLFELGRDFKLFVEPFGPTVVCVEAQVAAMFSGKAGPATPFKIGAAYGAILASCPTHPLVINPSEVRRRLRGKKLVSKDDIRSYCKAHFGNQHPAEPKSKKNREAVWDSAAVVLAMEPELDRLRAMTNRSQFDSGRNVSSVSGRSR